MDALPLAAGELRPGAGRGRAALRAAARPHAGGAAARDAPRRACCWCSTRPCTAGAATARPWSRRAARDHAAPLRGRRHRPSCSRRSSWTATWPRCSAPPAGGSRSTAGRAAARAARDLVELAAPRPPDGAVPDPDRAARWLLASATGGQAFDRAAAAYDDGFGRNPVGLLFRHAVQERAARPVPRGRAGAGPRLRHRARTRSPWPSAAGSGCTRSTPSPAMVERAATKAAAAASASAAAVPSPRGRGPGGLDGPFDGAFSDFGALNCADLRRGRPALATALLRRARRCCSASWGRVRCRPALRARADRARRAARAGAAPRGRRRAGARRTIPARGRGAQGAGPRASPGARAFALGVLVPAPDARGLGRARIPRLRRAGRAGERGARVAGAARPGRPPGARGGAPVSLLRRIWTGARPARRAAAAGAGAWRTAATSAARTATSGAAPGGARGLSLPGAPARRRRRAGARGARGAAHRRRAAALGRPLAGGRAPARGRRAPAAGHERHAAGAARGPRWPRSSHEVYVSLDGASRADARRACGACRPSTRLRAGVRALRAPGPAVRVVATRTRCTPATWTSSAAIVAAARALGVRPRLLPARSTPSSAAFGGDPGARAALVPERGAGGGASRAAVDRLAGGGALAGRRVRAGDAGKLPARLAAAPARQRGAGRRSSGRLRRALVVGGRGGRRRRCGPASSTQPVGDARGGACGPRAPPALPRGALRRIARPTPPATAASAPSGAARPRLERLIA